MTELLLAQSTIGWNTGKNNEQPNHPAQLNDILPRIAAFGYDGVEIHPSHLDGMNEDQLAAVRQQLDQLNLRVPLISPYFNFTKNPERAAASMQAARTAIHQARILGAEGIRTFTGGDRSADADADQWQRCVDCIQELADETATDNIHWCLHTHDWNLVDNVSGCERLLTLLDRSNVTLLYKPAYFSPHEHWNLIQLMNDTAVVQVTAPGKDAGENIGDLNASPIDYRAIMHFCQNNSTKDVCWMNFTWMGLNAEQYGEAAGATLQQWRDTVAE